MKYKVFVSSTMSEFERERKDIVNAIKMDQTLDSFFDVYTFENTPSSGQSADYTWQKNVLESDIYIGLIGAEYGTILNSGFSPTETEYDLFHKNSNNVFIFIKDLEKREEKTEKFISKIRDNHTYKLFNNSKSLISEIKRSLINFINDQIDNGQFDEKIIEYSSSNDIDMDSYDSYFKYVRVDALKQKKEEKTPEEMLSMLGAGIIENGIFHFNNAGALFFAKDITKFNIPHEIKMARFKNGDRLDIIDRKVSHNTIISLLNDVYSFFSRNTRISSVIVGMNRIDLVEYPFEVVREAIINAIAHRDYKISSSPITFYIFNNRIEIISPGKLIPPLTVNNLDSANPIHRNKQICDIFSKTTYMEHFGTGIQRMKDKMDEENLKEPEFEEVGEFFKVILWARSEEDINPDLYKTNIKSLDKLGLNERQIKAYTLMVNEKKTFTIKSYLECFKISKPTALKDLNMMVELNLVIKSKKGRSNVYSAT